MIMDAPLDPVRWHEDRVRIIDQRRLPQKLEYRRCETVEEVARAVETLAVRGAPAIGIAAGYGVVLGALRARENGGDPRAGATEAVRRLRTTRPTAVNLFHVLDRMTRVTEKAGDEDIVSAFLAEADAVLAEDLESGRRIAEAGWEVLIPHNPLRVLTHCNAGGLATGGWGTALAPLYKAHAEGRTPVVLAGETRPLDQGSRLTAWELARVGIPVQVVVDGASAHILSEGKVDVVIVGADRIAVNGDTANKIGTRSVALGAKDAGVPFYVAAPQSTFDFSLETGGDVPVEERSPSEILAPGTPESVRALNPAFDVTPARLITAWITDRGILQPPFTRERFQNEDL